MSPPMPRSAKRRWAGIAAVALIGAAGAALAQQSPESILPPGFGEAPKPAPATSPAAPAQAAPAQSQQPAPDSSPVDEQVVASGSLGGETLLAPLQARQPEYPSAARRDPRDAGVLDPTAIGLGERPWGAASGKFLKI